MNESVIKVKISFKNNEKLTDSIMKSLHPDNLVTPPYLEINEVFTHGEYAIILKGCLESKVVNSMRQTIDEILAIINMILKAESILSR